MVGEPVASENPGKDLFWSPEFFLNSNSPYLNVDRFELLSTEQIKAKWFKIFPLSLKSEPKLELNWEIANKEEFSEQVAQLKFLFQTKILRKTVPVVMDKAKSSSSTPLNHQIQSHLLYFLNRLTDLPPTLYPYGMIMGDDLILGATPEVLVEKSNSVIKTHALAGTTTDKNYNLLKDSKERLEHQYVIDDIKDTLSQFGSVHVGETGEKTLPHLKHLITPIELKGSHCSLLELVKCLHPTPALGGSPRDKAVEWLMSQPSATFRKRFGAPFGFVNREGDGLFLVAIRNIQIVDDELRLLAGCGIVPQSNEESEWMELMAKKNSVKAIWGCL